MENKNRLVSVYMLTLSEADVSLHVNPEALVTASWLH